jgi:GNAT superfamily N-acetyltransferase
VVLIIKKIPKMPENPLYDIRLMRKNDLPEAICLSMAEGWNQTESDWNLLLEGPDNICIVAEYGKKIAGTATALCHSGKVAWIGMVLVDKELRGQGIGRMLLINIIDRLNHIESVKLDATPAGQPLYKHLGFKEEYKILRMISPSFTDFYYKYQNGEPMHLETEELPEILNLDRSIFGTERSYLLKSLYQNYPLKAFLIKQNKKVRGYIFGRDGTRFDYIGPVSALSTDDAKSLIAKALIILNNHPVALDVLEDKEELVAWLESIGFVTQRHFIRMYLRSNSYSGIVKNQYLISGPEFG